MDPMKLRFYIEKYAKENRDTKLVETFYATPKTKSITGKFYARHEANTSLDAPKEFVDLIAKTESYSPKDIYKYRPPAVNMEWEYRVTLISMVFNFLKYTNFAATDGSQTHWSQDPKILG